MAAITLQRYSAALHRIVPSTRIAKLRPSEVSYASRAIVLQCGSVSASEHLPRLTSL